MLFLFALFPPYGLRSHNSRRKMMLLKNLAKSNRYKVKLAKTESLDKR